MYSVKYRLRCDGFLDTRERCVEFAFFEDAAAMATTVLVDNLRTDVRRLRIEFRDAAGNVWRLIGKDPAAAQ